MTQLHMNPKRTGALRPELSNSQPSQLCKDRTSTLNLPSDVDRHPPPVVPAGNLTPSYSLPATSWRFLLHSKWGGSDQLSPHCIEQKGWGRTADPLWLGKLSEVVSEKLGNEAQCISSKRDGVSCRTAVSSASAAVLGASVHTQKYSIPYRHLLQAHSPSCTATSMGLAVALCSSSW